MCDSINAIYLWIEFGIYFQDFSLTKSERNVNCFIKEHFCDDGKSFNSMKLFLSLENANPFTNAPIIIWWIFENH